MSRRGLSRDRRAFTNAGSGGGGGDFLPSDIAGLVLWLRSDLGITGVMSAVGSAGTSPPVVTLTGTPSPLLPVEIDITFPGLRGVALFQWKLGGIVQATGLVTGANVVLGTGTLAAQFTGGASTYLTDNVYTATVQVSAWADQSGNANGVTQGTANRQPGYVAADATLQGLPSLSFNGTTQTLSTANAVLTARPMTLVVVAKTTQITTQEFVVTASGSNANGFSLNVAASAANKRSIEANSVAFGQDNTSNATTNWEFWLATNDGSNNQQFRVNGVAHTLSASANVANLPSAGFFVGSGTGPNVFWSGSIEEVMAWPFALTASQITSLEGYLHARTGL